MQIPYDIFRKLAEVLSYPGPEYREIVEQTYQNLLKTDSEAAGMFLPFNKYCQDSDLFSLQELFTRTFDVQALTTLDIGYLLFGDDYKRGKLLVHLSEEHRKAGNDCGSELADHLPNLLRLLPLTQNDAFREELVRRIIMPALQRMITDFDPTKISKKEEIYRRHHRTLIEYATEKRTIFQYPLLTLHLLLEKSFGPAIKPQTLPPANFLKAVDNELSVEPQQ